MTVVTWHCKGDRPSAVACLLLSALAVTLLLGCGSGPAPEEQLGPGGSPPAAARSFKAYPLYWLGPRFQRWELSRALVPAYPGATVSFLYGTCTPGSDSGCAPPVEVQVMPLCRRLTYATRDPVWRRRDIRGAPVGSFGAPVLFSAGAQVKVFAPDHRTALHALAGLRSANGVEPVIDARQPIPPAPVSVLAGRRPCS